MTCRRRTRCRRAGGTGKTVAIVDAYDDPSAEADLAVYRSTYGLPPCTTANGCFRKVDQNGGTAYPAANKGWAEEISLDLDMVSAVCQNCNDPAGRGQQQQPEQPAGSGEHGKDPRSQRDLEQLGRR